MSSVESTTNTLGAHIDSGTLGRFIPEPASNAGRIFRGVLGGVASVAGQVLGGTASGLNSEDQSLLQLQVEMQKEMQLMTMYSNIEKSRHETQMAAIRNIRVG